MITNDVGAMAASKYRIAGHIAAGVHDSELNVLASGRGMNVGVGIREKVRNVFKDYLFLGIPSYS